MDIEDNLVARNYGEERGDEYGCKGVVQESPRYSEEC